MSVYKHLSLGERIKTIRKNKNISQKEMSKLLGIPYSTYSNYENNNREPSVEILKTLCEVLEISNDTVLNLTEKINNTSNIGVKIAKYRKSNGLTQKQLSSLIGKSEITVRKYENGDVQPPLNVIDKIAEALGVNTQELMTRCELENYSLNKLKEVIDGFQSDLLEISNNKNLIYDKGFLDGLKSALKIIEGKGY
ncbi:MAG: helix-turn-helix domain-containing protein [Clostridium sp.]